VLASDLEYGGCELTLDLLRVLIAAYTVWEDVERLLEALPSALAR
jgi:hypothetical protein